MSDSKKLESQQTNIESSTGHTESGDHNDFSGNVESGGIVLQGGEHKIEINQYFGSPPAPPETYELLEFEPATIEISAGTFRMGNVAGEGIPVYETPQHEVDLPAYRIAVGAITNAQYEEFIRETGKVVRPVMQWKGQSAPDEIRTVPVLGVTWEDAMQYCEWLSAATGRKYSLPNEAQWEKACRGNYPCSENIGRHLEWTCSLWGEKRPTPDTKYLYPWKKDDGRNNPNANRQVRRVLRGFVGTDTTGARRATARYGRTVDDPGADNSRYSFRIVLLL